MININKTIRAIGEAPFSLIVNTEATQLVTQLSEDLFKISLTYASEESIDPTDSVTVFDAFGCIKSVLLQVENTGDDFIVSEIQRTEGFGNDQQTTIGELSYYTVTANQDITVEWSLDDPSYYSSSVDGAFISLRQISSGIQQTTLRATVTNQNGYSRERSFTLFPCRTLAQPSSTILRFNTLTNRYEAERVQLRASTSCENALIDWSTVTISNNTPATVTQVPGQPYVNITSSLEIDSSKFFFSVSNTLGLRSNTSNVSLSTDADNVTTNDGFNIPPRILTVGFGENNIIINTTEIGIPGVTGINPSLTSANSATYSNGIIQADVTGQQAPTIGLNTEQGPTVISIIRELNAYVLSPIEKSIFCNAVTLDLSKQPNIETANYLVSGDGFLTGNVLTINNNNQALIVNVSNSDGQSSDVIIYACGDCFTDTVTSTCDTIVNLYDLLDGNPKPNGTWFSPADDPLPTTYDGTVTFSTNGLKSYAYTAPANVGEYECMATTFYTLGLTKISSGTVSNNTCANAQMLNSIQGAGSIVVSREISTNCSILTTYSGNTGNRIAYNYDQWYTWNSQVTGGQTVRVTVSLTGNGATPINDVALEIWGSCFSPVVTSNSQTINTYTAVFEHNLGTVPYFVQVLSNTAGNYDLSITQTII